MSGNKVSHFLLNLKYAGISRIFQIFSNILTLGFVVRIVGIDSWGTLTYAMSIVSVLSVIQLSISAASAKRLSDYYHSERYDDFNKYLSATFYMTAILISILAIIFIFVRFYFLNTVDESSDLSGIFVVVAINCLVQVSVLPFYATLQAINKTHLISKAILIGNIARFLLVFSLFLVYSTIFCYALLLLVEAILSLVAAFLMIKRSLKDFVFSMEGVDSRYLMSIVGFNIYNFLNNLVYILFLQTPVLILSRKYGTEVVGYYGLGLQINSVARQMLSALILPLTSQFNYLNSSKKTKELWNFFKISSFVFLFLTCLIVLNSSIFAEAVIYLFNLADVSEMFFKYFLIMIAFTILNIPSSLLTVTFEKVKYSSVAGLILVFFLMLCLSVFPFEFHQIPIVMAVAYIIYDLSRVYCIRDFFSNYLNLKTLFKIESLYFLTFLFLGAYIVDGSFSEIILTNLFFIGITIYLSIKKHKILFKTL